MEGDTRELLDLASAAVACEVGGGTAATEIVSVAVMRGVGPKLGDLHWREVTGMGQRCRATTGGNGNAGNCQACQETEGAWVGG